jgi:hypothetical protein
MDAKMDNMLHIKAFVDFLQKIRYSFANVAAAKSKLMNGFSNLVN